MTEPGSLPVIAAVTGRRSVRGFLPIEVPQETLNAILASASRAASGTNIQPWLVHVVSGQTRARLSNAVLAAAHADEPSPEYVYLSEDLPDPYLSRRRKIGFDLYEKLGIDRKDQVARKAAMLRNFVFFGAQTGLFFTMDRRMALGAWLDCGMFMQNVMIVARAYGLETCPQQSWCDFGAVVHRELEIPDGHILLSGMAIGVEDKSAEENTLVSTRVAVEKFTHWHS